MHYIFLFIILPLLSFSQHKIPALTSTRILFVFDGSQSMYGRWQTGMKIEIARKLLNELIDSLKYEENLELALRVYGHQSSVISKENRDCKDTRLEIPFSKGNHSKIKEKLKNITPRGTTPIAYSLEQAAGDFPETPNCRNIIILITDGLEECEGDPCAVSYAMQKKGIILKPFVIGMGISDELKKTFECVGNYFDAANEVTFRNVLNIVISQALNSTTAQVNLLDAYGNPTETNLDMTFYDSQTGAIRYNYIHTINNRGNPDTVILDPLETYKMVVHTIPPVTLDSIKLTAGMHNIIATDAPQGYLDLKAFGRSDYKSLQCIVRRVGEMQTLNIQDFQQMERYLVGKYDLEVLSMPRIYINNVDIKQSHTTTIEIPQPGIVSILTDGRGYGSIHLEEDNTLKLIYNLNENTPRDKLVLQPGKYRAFFRTVNAPASVYTIERKFTISSGSSTVVKLY